MTKSSGFFSRAAVLSVAAVISILVLSGAGIAADDPKIVRGWIWDSAGNPIDGAEVTVNIKQGETVRSTETETADETGFYSVTFWIDEWDIGETIEVISDYSGNQETNSSVATAAGLQYINVSYAFEIPEFGSVTGLLITGGLVGAVAVVTLVYFRKR